METPITNRSITNGTYDSQALEVISTIADVILVDGISAEKTGDRTYLANGQMTFTVVVSNTTDIDYESPVFTDELDPLITYVDGSFKVDGNDYTASFSNNTITSTLPTIPGGESLTITFLVQKA